MELQRFYDKTVTPAPTNPPPDYKLLTAADLSLHTKSTYTPPWGSHVLETFIEFVDSASHMLRQDIEDGKLHLRPNLNTLDFQASHSLREDKDLIIKPADKGSAIVVMNRSDYLQEIYHQLRGNTVYVKLPRDPTRDILELINRTLTSFLNQAVIDIKTRDFLTKANPIIPVFYTLPKVHKNFEESPGRPIVASAESILSPLSIFLEKILTPLICKNFFFPARYWRLSMTAMLALFDLKDLYTAIPHNKGITCVRQLLTSSLMHADKI
ncbi:unnamed protein product [Ranitomeya imitator]|uniref:Uncharacterized protein n=1 Tax=Ranitomeya imitator TaxID=111125 RepID=A0ABN9M779_9NEOB|nr:unnamed protein product [Ranitomeya imitator]